MNSKFLLLPTALMVAGHSAAEAKGKKSEIGRASCRERV